MINLTPKSIEAFDDFLGCIEVTKFKRHLRNLLLYYLVNEHEEPTSGYGDFIEDMKFTFDFLDVLEDEVKSKDAGI